MLSWGRESVSGFCLGAFDLASGKGLQPRLRCRDCHFRGNSLGIWGVTSFGRRRIIFFPASGVAIGFRFPCLYAGTLVVALGIVPLAACSSYGKIQTVLSLSVYQCT